MNHDQQQQFNHICKVYGVTPIGRAALKIFIDQVCITVGEVNYESGFRSGQENVLDTMNG